MQRMFVAAIICAASFAAQAADTVTMQRPTPWGEDAVIAGKIKRECTLPQQLPDFVAQYAKEKGVHIGFAPEVSAGQSGRTLVMKITDAVSSGNAFLGHHKSVTVRGTLYQDGNEIGSFVGRRNSMGGAFAGFKGSCSVLGRTVKVLGQDIAGFLVQPKEKATLGDLQ